MLNNLEKYIHPWHSCLGLKLIKGKTRYRDNQDHSRWIFHDEENKLYYKIWNDTYIRRDNIIHGMNSGFYDEVTCPGLEGIIMFDGYCRGYIMHEMENFKSSLKDFYEIVKQKTLSSDHFYHDYSANHVLNFNGLPCLIDLDGIHHMSELDEFIDRKWHSSFVDDNYKKFVCDIVR